MSQIKLSVLIPSTHTRYNTFLPKIQDSIFNQYNSLSALDQLQVEILVLTDTKNMCLGEKRNKLIDISQGEYIVFVDDDDRLSDTYIKTLLEATKTDADAIVFTSMVSINGNPPKPCYYSKDHLKDYNTHDAYYRIPNHICCVKKEVSLKSSFPNILKGEDSGYSKLLLPHIKTEHKIDKVLYYYDYSDETTETQQALTPSIRRREQPPIVDVIILSNAKDNNFKQMTQNAIDTCIAGANSLPINVIVIEQKMFTRYNNADVINIDKNLIPFNYNKYCNIGAKHGYAEWILFANNDLAFQNGWLHELLIANNDLVSPRCPKDPRQVNIEENTKGETNAVHFSGWCFMIKRSLWGKIGGLDEDFLFWYSDDAVIQQCINNGVYPMIVANSNVIHLGSTTLKTLDKDTAHEYTWQYTELFNTKYNQNKFVNNKHYQQWKEKHSKK